MRKCARFLAIFCICSTILSGCRQNYSKNVYRAVTQVDVVSQQENVLIRRHYTAQPKMRAILLYLRILKPGKKPNPPPNSKEDNVYLIAVKLSDGTIRYYRQKDHRYFSSGSGPWLSIDPSQAAGLYTILRQFPSDA